MNNIKNEFEKIMNDSTRFDNEELNEMQQVIDATQNNLKELAQKKRINVLKLGKRYNGKLKK